jgi:broad specificity phosphatase PhoE
MTARLHLLCHAVTRATREASFARDDEPIEPAEAGRVASLASGLPRLDLVLVAPARAARETAAALRLKARIEPALADQDFGRWRGAALGDVLAAEPQAASAWMRDPASAPHGGESIAGLIARVGGWLAGGPAARRVLAVTHAAVLRAAVVHVLAAPAEAFWAIDVGPLTSVVLTHDGRIWRLRLPDLAGGEAKRPGRPRP